MFVGGLKDDTTEDMIRDCFSGNIEAVEMIKDKASGKSRGFCFVTFDDPDTVDKHVCELFFFVIVRIDRYNTMLGKGRDFYKEIFNLMWIISILHNM